MKVKVKPCTIRTREQTHTAEKTGAINLHSVSIRQLLKPSLVSMAVSGCYTYDANLVKTGRTTSKGKCSRMFGIIYRLVVFIFVIGGCIKTAAAFSKLYSAFLQLNVIRCGWYTQCLVVFLISLKSSTTKYGGQRKAFNFWDEKIRPELEELGLKIPEENIRKRQKIYVALAVVVYCFGIAISILVSTDTFTNGFGVFFVAPFEKSALLIILENVVFMILTAIWIFPMFYIIVVSTLLISTFEVFNKFLEKHIEQNSATMTCKFQKIRQLHLNLCKVVSYLDQDFRCYFAAIFLFSVGLSCFILYVILKSQDDIMELVMFLFWLTSIMTLLGAISVFAAFVNEEVSINK